jgi:hypothetical protein
LTPHSLDNPSQDLSDTMWNLSVAMYAKAGGVPWTLADLLPVSSAFIGISFNIKKMGQDQIVLTGVAQLYNRYGLQVESLVIDCTQPGTDFTVDRDLFDEFRQSYHLSEAKAHALMEGCLTKYRSSYGGKLLTSRRKRRTGSRGQGPTRRLISFTSFLNQSTKSFEI